MIVLHTLTPDHPMGIEPESQIFHLRDTLSRTEAGISMNRDAVVEFCGYGYKRHANSVLSSTVRSLLVSMSTWIGASDCHHTRMTRYRVPGDWQVLDGLVPGPTSA